MWGFSVVDGEDVDIGRVSGGCFPGWGDACLDEEVGEVGCAVLIVECGDLVRDMEDFERVVAGSLC